MSRTARHFSLTGIVILAGAILLLLGVRPASAVVPQLINYQGYVRNASSHEPLSGTFAMNFAIYADSTDGTPLWSETHAAVVVNAGIFSVLLGSTTTEGLPEPLFTGATRWLETVVAGESLVPRRPFVSVAYAFRAAHADVADSAPTDSLWSTDGTNVWRGSGNVGIGTSSPTSALDVKGVGQFVDDSTFPDTKEYGTLGVTRDPSTQNLSYLALTKTGILPWGIGVAQNNNLIFGVASASPSRTIPVPLFSIQPFTGNVGIGTTVPQARLDIASGAGNELVFSGTGDGNIVAPNQDLRIDAGLGWSLLFGADGISNQLIVRHNQTIVNGDLAVNGSLNVTNTKCRVVTTDYGQLKMNAVESAHALFMDDEPSARLVNGRCRVDLSPKFLATVTVNERYPLAVNVTFYGRHGSDWYVERDAASFTVIDPSGSNAEFSWDVKARQKGYEDTNLDPVTETAAK